MPISPGDRLGPYEILAPLGAGGMGEVWRARDGRLGREVALKVLPESFLSDPERRARFEREARLLATLSHVAVAAVYAFEEIPGPPARHVLAMELLSGETLRELLRRGPLPEARVREMGAAIAEGLAAAHERGIVHRDLKPENVLVRPDGRPKLLDFGLAKRTGGEGEPPEDPEAAMPTREGVVLGTSGYMSPEHVIGAPVDARSDVFALGCVLYEMAAGRRAFARGTPAETLAAILRDAPAPLGGSASPGLERIVRRCLEKRPEERFASAGEIAVALREPATGSEPTMVMGAGRRRARLRRPAAAVLAVVAAAVAAGVLLALGVLYVRRGPARDRAETARSLAVLPFENLTDDAHQSSLSDAMTEALTTNLGRVSALRVTSRSAVAALADSKTPATRLGRALGVDALVTGSLQKSGDALRVNVQVVDAASGRQVWSAPFAQSGGNIFGLQDRVSRAILAALRVPLTPSEESALKSVPTANMAAYDHYVRGRLHVRHENAAENAAAIEELEKAVALDPSFAAAHAELSHAYVLRLFFFSPGDREAAARAAAASERALSLDPDLGLAHYARGLLLWTPANGFAHEPAMQAYRRAVALDPSYDDAHHQLGLVEMHVGLLPEAAAEFATAVQLDPTNELARNRRGAALLYQLRSAEALAVFRETPRRISPSLWTYQVATALLRLGRRAEAEAALEGFHDDGEKDTGGVVASVEAMVAALAGNAPAVERFSARAAEGRDFGHFHHTAYNLACAWALLGRPREAMPWLRSAAENGFPCYPLFEKDPFLDGLRKDGDFAAFLENQRQAWTARRALAGRAG